MLGKTPMQTFLDALPLAKEKLIGGIATGNSLNGSNSQQRPSDRQLSSTHA